MNSAAATADVGSGRSRRNSSKYKKQEQVDFEVTCLYSILYEHRPEKKKKKKTVNSRYLEIEINLKLLIYQSKFSGSRKFTLRYQ